MSVEIQDGTGEFAPFFSEFFSGKVKYPTGEWEDSHTKKLEHYTPLSSHSLPLKYVHVHVPSFSPTSLDGMEFYSFINYT